jgi:hypothetical protein
LPVFFVLFFVLSFFGFGLWLWALALGFEPNPKWANYGQAALGATCESYKALLADDGRNQKSGREAPRVAVAASGWQSVFF